jgi:hypothetical protein
MAVNPTTRDLNLPRGLPKCELLALLASKVGERQDIAFDVLAKLNEFRQRVAGEVAQINRLFPEYTPHDEIYHLKRLFDVADTVLGPKVLEAMNVAELLVLAIALYGHDWGMAVSDAERDYIQQGVVPSGSRVEELCTLPQERERFLEFAICNGLTPDGNGCFVDVPVTRWRAYVRETHASRSAERVRGYFDPIDGGVAEASARACEGHAIGFDELDDHNLYPVDFSVLRESVNLRAVSVYVRLIDLLDFAEDRTPYVIWKFVAPRDEVSRMEWAKHRALRPITCPSYQSGRIIQVDGSTNDYEVYAALEDLRNYADQQLRGCSDCVARMHDPRHSLNIYHISWRVAARGFNPISIRFEFDRNRMFEILGSEIYQGDHYVFLRELLQNSIDAIRMRREVLRRKGIDPTILGTITVRIAELEGKRCIVWSDDGIGMDEHIVRNYLAVAGKSYYSSDDFRREGLSLDPISRFGIGILSCFMAADRIEIDTFRELHLAPEAKPLRIAIPAVDKQFRVEQQNPHIAKTGTTVRVYLRDTVKELDVTGYLSSIAGFAEFPIVVEDGIGRIVIAHPKADAAWLLRTFGRAITIRQLSLGFPLERAILPQDVETARRSWIERRLDIGSDLGLEGYEGAVTFVVPRDDSIEMAGQYFDDVDTEGILVVDKSGRGPPAPIRWLRGWHSYLRSDPREGIAPSAKSAPSHAVYRDGILVATAEAPSREVTLHLVPTPVPRVVVNLPKARARHINVARTELLLTVAQRFSPKMSSL